MLHAARPFSRQLSLLFLAFSLLFAIVNPAPLTAAERVMLILDSSGSMWGQVDGVPKYRIARKVIGNVLQDIGQKVNMGVMAYGHRRKGDCSDIQTVIPVGPVNAGRYMSRIRKINPKGKTPISAAVRQAAEALKYTEENATVVLVSDGLETCNADPCALASELERLGVNFTVHVVGFDLGNEDTQTLSCLAENTGGVFLQASNANELSAAIGQVVEAVQEAPAQPQPVVQPEPEPQPEPQPVAGPTRIAPRAFLVAGGKRLADAYFRLYNIEQDADGNRKRITQAGGKPKFEVPPGKYYITAERGDAWSGLEVDIAEGRQNIIEIVLNAGLVRPKALLGQGSDPLTDAYFRIYQGQPDADGNRKRLTQAGGKPKFTVPAGQHHITAERGDAWTGVDIDVKAGETHNVQIVMNAGILVPKAYWTEGGDPLKDAYFRVYQAATDDDGNRKRITQAGGKPKFTLAAGRYYMTAEIGDAWIGRDVEVKPAEATEIALILNAGVLIPKAYYAEGDDPIKDAYFRVYEAKVDADGNRKRLTQAGGKPKFKLAAGTYYITAEVGDAWIGRDVEVKPAEATDVALILNAGVLIPKAYYAEGEDPIKDAYFRVYEAAKNADGQRKRLTQAGGKPKFKLPAGKYYITAEVGDARIGREVEVGGGEATEVALILGAGVLIPTASYAEGGDPIADAYFRVYEAAKNTDGNRKRLTQGGGKPKFKLLAGSYYITAEVGDTVVGKTVDVTPGQATEIAIVLDAGVLALFASAAEGGDPLKQVYFRVYQAKKDIEGNRKQVAGSGGQPKFKLPAGQYLVTAKSGEAIARMDVTVTAGELTETTVNLNAGRLAAEAVDAASGQQVTKGLYFRVFTAKKDIEGNRKQVSSGGGKAFGTLLPAGAYIVQVTIGGGNNIAGTAEVEIEAGQLAEVKVPVESN